MPRLLLLLPTRTYRAHDFMEAAGRLGVEVAVGSEREQALAALSPEKHLVLAQRRSDLMVSLVLPVYASDGLIGRQAWEPASGQAAGNET